jgi:hypothetical protein
MATKEKKTAKKAAKVTTAIVAKIVEPIEAQLVPVASLPTIAHVEAIETNEVIPGLVVQRMTPIEAMKPERQEKSFDFPVQVERLVTPSGVASDHWAIVDTFNNRIVGGYKKEDTLIRNASLIERLEVALAGLGYKWKRSTQVTRGGSAFQAEYEIEGADQTACDFPIRPVLIVKNSYDSSSKIIAEMGFKMLACLNKMDGIMKAFSLLQRHGAKVTLDSIVEILEAKLATIPDGAGMIAPLHGIDIDDDKAATILANIAHKSRGDVSHRIASRMLMNWHQPDANEAQQGGNMFRLLNAGTRLLRDLEVVRPTVANKARHYFVGACVLVGKGQDPHGNALEQLLAPPVKPLIDLSLIESVKA